MAVLASTASEWGVLPERARCARLVRMELPLRLAGAVWGHVVGDTVGVPYEFLPPASIGVVRFGATGTYHQPPGTWSDDGALMLALLDSLLSAGFDPEDQGRRFLAWRDRVPTRPTATASSRATGISWRWLTWTRRGHALVRLAAMESLVDSELSSVTTAVGRSTPGSCSGRCCSASADACIATM
jgi:hypothetical protein